MRPDPPGGPWGDPDQWPRHGYGNACVCDGYGHGCGCVECAWNRIVSEKWWDEGHSEECIHGMHAGGKCQCGRVERLDSEPFALTSRGA